MSQVTSVRPIKNGSTLTVVPPTVTDPPGTGTISKLTTVPLIVSL